MNISRLFVLAVCCVLGPVCLNFQAKAAVNITQHHNHASRDGLFIDPAFTKSSAAGLQRDLAFNGSISGNVYAQPLYIEGGPGGVAMLIAVTESNNVYALDAANGTVIWHRNVGPPPPVSQPALRKHRPSRHHGHTRSGPPFALAALGRAYHTGRRGHRPTSHLLA